MGKKGAFTIPAELRKRFGLIDGSLIIAQECDEGILLKPATASPLEMYGKERIAEFLLSSATDKADYDEACAEVRKMGLNPDDIQHRKPEA